MSTNAAIRHQYLDAMGVQVWVERGAQSLPSVVTEELDTKAMNLGQLSETVQGCQRCELSGFSSNKVFSQSNKTSSTWFLVGDAPYEQSNALFAPKAILLLNEILASVDDKLETNYITTAVKCAQQTRVPSTTERQRCEPYLLRQIELVSPKVVLLLGEKVAQQVLRTDKKLEQLRGQLHILDNSAAAVVVTYHPADVLLQPSLKRKVWQDIQLAKAQVGR